MLERAKRVIDTVAKETDSIILMHSLSGKDSIALLDLCYPRFKRVVCVYMYLVKDLQHMQNYYNWAKTKYPNVEFIQVPHYAVYSYIKYGFLGCKKNPNQRLFKLSDIVDKVRERTSIEWVCCGFKQSDSLNRRLMLRTYSDGQEAICWKSKKFYPLSTYKNKDVLKYIEEEGLKSPESYGTRGQSVGTDITSLGYQLYLKENYPSDLEKIYEQFPLARVVMMDYIRSRYEK